MAALNRAIKEAYALDLTVNLDTGYDTEEHPWSREVVVRSIRAQDQF